MNAFLDILNTIFDALFSAFAVSFSIIGKAMLANIHAAEWIVAVVVALSCLLFASRRGHPLWALLLFMISINIGVWLSWTTGHLGVTVQQAALAAVLLHVLKDRYPYKAK